MSIPVFAPAKINLTLRVGRPRSDGLHPIESAVAFADIGDEVQAAPSEVLSLEIEGPFAAGLSAGEDNLVLRAAHALAAAAGIEPRAALRLTKNLPVASGIGGGSADAAAALRALCNLWGLDWSNDQLATLGARLGADVPVFFTAGMAAFMTGIGEVCTVIEAPRFPAVLVNPLQPLATADVYRQFDAMGLGRELAAGSPPIWNSDEDALTAIAEAGNDLFAPARILVPLLDEVAAALTGAPGVRYAGLSGSGATMFALCEDWDAAAQLAVDLSAKRPSWWIVNTGVG